MAPDDAVLEVVGVQGKEGKQLSVKRSAGCGWQHLKLPIEPARPGWQAARCMRALSGPQQNEQAASLAGMASLGKS